MSSGLKNNEVIFFKAPKRTNRFRKDQKVWVVHQFGNHSYIKFKWRGTGRYVAGIIANEAYYDSGVKVFEVSEKFYKFLHKDFNTKQL